MPGNKDRLYVCLHARSGQPTMPGLEDTYHWSYITGPKKEDDASRGTRFHAKDALQVATVGEHTVAQKVWEFEEASTSLQPSNMILVRIIIGKVKDHQRLREAFRRVPVQQDTPGWNCVSWAIDGYYEAVYDKKALDKAIGDWESVRKAAMWYVAEKKAAHRFDREGEWDTSQVPTFDLLVGKELIP